MTLKIIPWGFMTLLFYFNKATGIDTKIIVLRLDTHLHVIKNTIDSHNIQFL